MTSGNNLLWENNVQVSIHQSVSKGRERVNKCVTSFMDYELKSGSRLTIHDVVFFLRTKIDLSRNAFLGKLEQILYN